MKINAFIFARGGSKGLPRKNIKLLAGKPLIQYSIETAKKLNVDNVFVSTEDKEIAYIAEQLGAIVIQRPIELATDSTPEWLAWRHAVNYVTQNYGAFDLFISLPTTSPLRSAEDVNKAIELFSNQNADACISITKANRSPYFNMVKKTDAGECVLINQLDSQVSRRQDVPQSFDMTTVVYVTEPDFILNNSSLFDGKVVGVEIPKERAVDIDDIYDFLFAETLLKFQDVSC